MFWKPTLFIFFWHLTRLEVILKTLRAIFLIITFDSDHQTGRLCFVHFMELVNLTILSVFFLNYVAPDFTWLIEMHIILKDILWSPHERNFNNFSVLGRILWFIWISFVNQACIRNMARDLIGEMTWLKSVKFSTQDFLMKEFEFDEKLLTRHLSHVIFPMKPLAIEFKCFDNVLGFLFLTFYYSSKQRYDKNVLLHFNQVSRKAKFQTHQGH
jgi:hypothetical protein